MSFSMPLKKSKTNPDSSKVPARPWLNMLPDNEFNAKYVVLLRKYGLTEGLQDETPDREREMAERKLNQEKNELIQRFAARGFIRADQSIISAPELWRKDPQLIRDIHRLFRTYNTFKRELKKRGLLHPDFDIHANKMNVTKKRNPQNPSSEVVTPKPRAKAKKPKKHLATKSESHSIDSFPKKNGSGEPSTRSERFAGKNRGASPTGSDPLESEDFLDESAESVRALDRVLDSSGRFKTLDDFRRYLDQLDPSRKAILQPSRVLDSYELDLQLFFKDHFDECIRVIEERNTSVSGKK